MEFPRGIHETGGAQIYHQTLRACDGADHHFQLHNDLSQNVARSRHSWELPAMFMTNNEWICTSKGRVTGYKHVYTLTLY